MRVAVQRVVRVDVPQLFLQLVAAHFFSVVSENLQGQVLERWVPAPVYNIYYFKATIESLCTVIIALLAKKVKEENELAICTGKCSNQFLPNFTGTITLHYYFHHLLVIEVVIS